MNAHSKWFKAETHPELMNDPLKHWLVSISDRLFIQGRFGTREMGINAGTRWVERPEFSEILFSPNVSIPEMNVSQLRQFAQRLIDLADDIEAAVVELREQVQS